ncbi:chemotaxis protein CheA [Salinimonas lutimaris]|uniref:chemotaxis protein CheA n=1 Tax=Salinimonas lutimaris TaxID=914153 RepID=UPI0010BF9AA6|nr:chemotaxis protein CheA [Salinimonas lutimaris]
MNEMLDVFIGESREGLETASQQLLALQSEGFSQERIDTIFRDLHTIKGSSGLFDIVPLTRLAHAAEDLLDSIRAGQTPFTDEVGDLLLETLDQISDWFDDLEVGNEDVNAWETTSFGLSHRVRAYIQDETQQTVEPTDAPDDIAALEPPLEAAPALSPELLQSLAWMPVASVFNGLRMASGKNLQLLAYTPDQDGFFRGEDPVNVVLATPGLVDFTLTPKQEDTNPDDVFLCHLDIQAVAANDAAGMAAHMAYYEGQYTSSELHYWQLVCHYRDTINRLLEQDHFQALKDAINEGDGPQVRSLSDFALTTSNPQSDEFAICQWLLSISDDAALLARLQASLTPSVMAAPEAPRQTDISENSSSQAAEETGSRVLTEQARAVLKTQIAHLERISGTEQEAMLLPSVTLIIRNILLKTDNRVPSDSNCAGDWIEVCKDALNATRSVEEVLNEAVDAVQVAEASANTAPSVETGPSSLANKIPDAEAAKAGERQVTKTLKVNQEKIDYLMDLIGELTVAKNSLPYLARQAEDGDGRKLSKQIKSHFSIVNRLTEELQSAVLQIRMVPVSHVFQRYPRLVRDLSRKLNKKIELVMQGEDTEFDKNLIESLSEPLIHLLRNSIDHGIEAPEFRAMQGKPETGTIHLIATPKDDNVIIEIRDDGKGIDPENIKMLAYQKGIINETQLDSIEDNEALQLIFAPGFSTMETVSDLSGRGVGMDAVKTMVHHAGGTIEMESTVGVGTTFKLILPQTMSVNRVMMFEVNEQMFGVSMDSVVETVKVKASEVQLVKNHPVLVLREKLVPLHCLREKLGFIPKTHANDEEQSILVVSTGNGEFGLIIDKFHEGIDVIQKPLEGVMAGFSHLSGTALLGDGRVLLIINAQELVACR